MIDLAKLKKGTYSVLRDEVTTVPQSFVGRNAIEFLKAIERSANFKEFVPAENSDDLLFTGTVAGGSFWDIGHAKSPVDYSSQYTFALLNNNHIHSRQVIDTQLTSLNESLFTEDAQYYLQKLSADNIVHLYGTHVIVDAVVGLATNAMFRSVNLGPTDESIYENAYYYA